MNHNIKTFFKEFPIVPPYSAAQFGGLRPIHNKPATKQSAIVPTFEGDKSTM